MEIQKSIALSNSRLLLIFLIQYLSGSGFLLAK